MNTIPVQQLKSEALERLLKYVRINTASDSHIEEIPSTARQWDLLKVLQQELEELGIDDITLNEHGYLIARLPSNLPAGSDVPTIGLMAHVDTVSDVSADGVKPQVHENYDGTPIRLEEGRVLSPEEYPELAKYVGDTIITSDGTTLLGADDKAGVAEIMTALSYLQSNPEIPHGELEIIFTPDEETGKGMNLFPVDQLRSSCCYTFDGGERGEVETECFNAHSVKVTFTGSVIHLGHARGKLVNAVTMAGAYIDMLPGSESPEATDGRYGYYAPMEINGELDSAELIVFLRDFEKEGMDRRLRTMATLAEAVEAAFPGGKVEVEAKKMYANMRSHMEKDSRVLEYLKEAVRAAGVEPQETIIRGGTDGARLSEMGVPTPNVFTGGHNFHSRYEWAALSVMGEAVLTALNLVRRWAGEEPSNA
jgi:tripeptide aminopeptidase